MPIYEYRCEACHGSTEVLQKASDPAPENCRNCGAGPMVKQLSLSAFSLKGTGWYVTDFKGGNSTSAKSDEAKPTTSTEGTPSTAPTPST